MAKGTVTRRRARPRPRRRSQDRSPEAVAEAAGLRYVTDVTPGLRRKGAGKEVRYEDAEGRRITDEDTLARIRSLAIPPAWTDVWICPDPEGHLQATGRDAKGRKQYRYHPRWREAREAAKYRRLIRFGRALPRIRERVEADLAKPGLPREKVLALVVSLLDETCMRVGNPAYREENGTFGVTTLHDDHAQFEGGCVVFEYTAKGGKERETEVCDGRLARLVRACRDLPGEELFQYTGEDGEPHPVRSDDVNAYLREASGQAVTAKDFRTWAGTVLAARELADAEAADTKKARRSTVVDVVKRVAGHLGNTPRVTRSSYVHPGVLDAYLEDGRLDLPTRERDGLTLEEAGVLRFIEKRGG